MNILAAYSRSSYTIFTHISCIFGMSLQNYIKIECVKYDREWSCR